MHSHSTASLLGLKDVKIRKVMNTDHENSTTGPHFHTVFLIALAFSFVPGKALCDPLLISLQTR